MKVYDIILEAPNTQQPIRPSNIPKRQWKAMTPAQRQAIAGTTTPTPPAASPTPATTPTTTTAATPSNKKNVVSRLAKGPKSPTVKSTSKNPIAKVVDAAKARARRNTKWLAQRERILGEKYGWKLKTLFRLFGIWEILTETWATTDVLDEMYQNGEIDDIKLEEGREFAWGLFNTAVVAPTAIKILSNALLLTRLLRFLKNSLAVVSAPASLGASIAAAAASEAFFIWLQKWIVSQEGQKWFSTYLYEVIRYFGKPTDAVANKLQQAYNTVTGKGGDDYYDDAKKRREKSGKGQAAQPDSKLPPPPVDQSETWPRHVRYTDGNFIFVGGKMVTDEKGKLIPGVQNEIRVQGARATAKLLKLKDPLADIPLNPGQEPIKPI